MAEGDSGRDDVSYQEMGVDVGGLTETEKQSSETVSQISMEETDGRGTKKKKKAQKVIQDGKP